MVIEGFYVVSGTSSTGVKTTGYEVHLSFMVRGNSVGTSYPRPEPPILPKWCDNDGLGKSSASLKMEGAKMAPLGRIKTLLRVLRVHSRVLPASRVYWKAFLGS